MVAGELSQYWKTLMARRRFFVDRIDGSSAVMRGEDARHLTRVLRVRPGQQFEISDQSTAWLGEIAEARGDYVLFRVLEPVPSPEIPVRIVLYAALIKFDRFEWMIEKASELGVEAIQPVETARSEKGLMEAARKRIERWRRIAHEAGQQSRRLRPPAILPAIRWQEALAEAAAFRYMLEENSAPPLLSKLPVEGPAQAKVALLTGPEGGWTEDERESAVAAGWQPASMGPQVLRAETAALAAVAVILNAWLAGSSGRPL